MAEIKLRAMREEYQSSGAIPSDVFQEFRKRLIGLTDVTHSFFDKLVKQLEKGFSGIEKDYAGELPTSAAGPSGSGGEGASGSGTAAEPVAGSKKRRGGRSAGDWLCLHCTLLNTGASDCAACGLPRPD